MFIVVLAILNLNATIHFTPQEQKYINSNPTIRVHNELTWSPFNFNENGEPKGLSIDFMNLIAKKVGLKIEYISGPSWSEFLTMMKDNRLDVMLNIVKNEEREKFLNFTKPYQFVPHCIVVRNDSNKKIEKFEDLLDKNIALEDGFYNHNYFTKHHPNTKLTLRKDTLGVLQAVSYGEADATIGILPIEAYIIRTNGLNNLKIIGISDNALFAPKELRIATSIHNPILRDIIEKGLNSISENEKNEIVNRWVSVDLEAKIDWELIIKIVTFFLVIAIGSAYWMWRIKRVQNQLEYSNLLMKKLMDSIPSPIFYKNEKGEFIGFNKAYNETFGIDSSNLIGKTVMDLDYLPLEDRKLYHNEDTNVIQNIGSVWREQEMVFSDGVVHHTIYSVNGFADTNNKPAGLIGIFTDISEQKENERVLKNTLKELEIAKKEVEEIHKRTSESIEYASLIQHTLIPSHDLFRKYFKDYFVIWHPKDVVGGDIYFFEEFENSAILMVIDCTGHGVPGAFVTMLVKAIERQIISQIKYQKEAVEPAKILTIFNKNMRQILQQESDESISNAGFD